MRVLSLLALVPSVVCTAAVQPNTNAIAPQTNGPSVPVQLINATQLGSDPRFTTDPEPGPDSINPIAAYMTTLALLFNIAQEDFNGQLTSKVGLLEKWPELVITVRTINANPLPNRFAIWGLLAALYYMAEQSFTDGAIYLKWQSQRVGVVRFQQRRPGSLQAAGSFDSLNSTDIPGLGASGSRTVYKSGGQDLPEAGVYVSLASAIAEMAQYGVRDRMPQIWQYLADYQTAIWVEPETRTTPPWMDVGSGLDAVWSTANFITDQQRYAEYSTYIFNGRELVGQIIVSGDPNQHIGARVEPGGAQRCSHDVAGLIILAKSGVVFSSFPNLHMRSLPVNCSGT